MEILYNIRAMKVCALVVLGLTFSLALVIPAVNAVGQPDDLPGWLGEVR